MLIINGTGWSGRTDFTCRTDFIYGNSLSTRQIEAVTWILPRRRLPYLHGELLWFVPYSEAREWKTL